MGLLKVEGNFAIEENALEVEFLGSENKPKTEFVLE